jgi:hypothetical protein
MIDDIKPPTKQDTTDKYENIAVLPTTKARFKAAFIARKNGQRQFYIDTYLNELLDLEAAQEGK